MLIQTLTNSLLQIILFSLPPFVWWLAFGRREQRFPEWLGFKKIGHARENRTLAWMLGSSLAFLLVSVFMLFSLKDVEMATSQFSGLGPGALPAILIYAVLNTALPEEILFRGFLLKRLSARLGFAAGNLIQSLLFGLMHGVLFFSAAGTVKALLIIIFTGGIGWCLGFVNEKKAEGSILPSWGIHAAANLFSGLCSALSLLP